VPDAAGPGERARGTGRRKGPLDRRLLNELPGTRASLAGSVAAGLLASAAVVAQAVALAGLLAGAMPGAHPVDRARLFVVLGAGIAGRAVAALVGELFANAGASRAKAELRAHLVRAALERAPLAGRAGAPPGVAPLGDDGEEERGAEGPGEIAALAGRGLDALDVYIGRCLPDMVLAAAAPLALLVAVGVLDWISALIMGVVVALFPIFGALVGRATMSLATERWGQVERLGRLVADLFQGLPTLRAFGRTADERARIAAMNEALARSSSKVLRVAFLSALVLDTLGSVSVALVAVPLGLRLVTGSVHLAAALAVLVVAPEVFLPLRRASAEFHESTEGLAAADRAFALIGPREAGVLPDRPAARGPRYRPPDHGGVARVAAERRAPDPLCHRVELRSVTVSVPGRDRPVLDSASLCISPGETVVLVGPSGAGKSTVLSTLLGFTVPSSGAVVVGGEELPRSALDDWRRYLTYLPEHPTLLGGALADNLRLANQAATDDDLRDALAAAGAPELAGDLSSGLATPLGDGGRPVSAGELQRIALARVLLRPASLYLLDEPTVHLDERAEAKAMAALSRALEGKSALIVSHRPGLALIADRVVALQDGRFVGAGNDLRARVPA